MARTRRQLILGPRKGPPPSGGAPFCGGFLLPRFEEVSDLLRSVLIRPVGSGLALVIFGDVGLPMPE